MWAKPSFRVDYYSESRHIKWEGKSGIEQRGRDEGTGSLRETEWGSMEAGETRETRREFHPGPWQKMTKRFGYNVAHSRSKMCKLEPECGSLQTGSDMDRKRGVGDGWDTDKQAQTRFLSWFLPYLVIGPAARSASQRWTRSRSEWEAVMSHNVNRTRPLGVEWETHGSISVWKTALTAIIAGMLKDCITRFIHNIRYDLWLMFFLSTFRIFGEFVSFLCLHICCTVGDGTKMLPPQHERVCGAEEEENSRSQTVMKSSTRGKLIATEKHHKRLQMTTAKQDNHSMLLRKHDQFISFSLWCLSIHNDWKMISSSDIKVIIAGPPPSPGLRPLTEWAVEHGGMDISLSVQTIKTTMASLILLLRYYTTERHNKSTSHI